MEGATILLQNSRHVLNRLASQLEEQALWINAELEDEVWECVALLCSMASSLEIADGLLHADAISAEQHVGAVLENCVLGRGLLYNSLALGIRVGVIEDEAEIYDYCNLLDPKTVEPVDVIVAYLDYLNTSEEIDDKFASTYPMIGRRLVGGLPSFPWRSYYWTSSDTYCLFGVLNRDSAALQIASFLEDLIWLQRNERARREHVGWMWQIGVTIAKARVLGDVLVPSRGSVVAAKLMEVAKRKDRKGGLILIDSRVVTRSEAKGLRELLRRVREDDRLLGISRQPLGRSKKYYPYALRQVGAD
jgi:hypothetical protein